MTAPPPFSLRSVDHAHVDDVPDPLADMRSGSYGGLLVQDVLEGEALREGVACLEAASSHRRRLSPDGEIAFIGVPLQWSPPDLDAYFEGVSRVDDACARVLPPGARLLERVYALLARVARRPLRVFCGERGAYAPATLRRFPPGEEVGAHFELGQLEAPSYQEILPHLDTATLFSFVAMLSVPEQGGELAVYDLRWGDADAAAVRSGERFEGALQGRYPPHLVTPRAGDVLVWNSGVFAHRVLRVGGARPRWTAGGFLAFSRDGREVIAWA